MLPIQSVLYENEPIQNVTIRKCTIRNVTDPIIITVKSIYLASSNQGFCIRRTEQPERNQRAQV